ncbi:cation transporter [soil metagenome]
MNQLTITGMTCSHCQSAVKTALESVAGVQKAEVDLANGVARVEGDADVSKLVAAVEEEGYGAAPAA